MTELRLSEISKRYGTGRGGADAIALDTINLTVRDGEFYTLVGPSGCGKTTTLRLIAGFEGPTTGSVCFNGEEMTGVEPEHRDVGVVFQSYALFPHMNVAENVGYGLRFRDPPGEMTVEDRVADLLDLVDLPAMGDRDPDQLSGGQRQRVALARALAPAPDLLLLDEPLSALDAQLREFLRRRIAEIQSDLGITTVYVTHDQEEALAISDRVAVMNDGRIEQVATPQDLYREPSTRFVAEFIGDNNVFEGSVTAVAEAPRADDSSAGGDSPRSTPSDPKSGDDGPIATVDVGGETLRVALAGRDDAADIEVGDRLTFCVRPEYLRIDGGENRIWATVASAEFLGETTRITLDWRGRDLLVRTRDPLSGEVVVGFDPADAHVISVDEV